MSTGGIYTLINNDGKQDRLMLATQLLNKRLLSIEQARARDPRIKDPTPTLADIEQTHIIFVNAHFKPFAAIGYEYGKTNPQSGASRLGGSTIQFSIPQFGDFFNDMALRIKLSSVTAGNAAYWSDPLNNPADGRELVRYVNYAGQRLTKNISFEVNSNPLDKYDTNVINMHQKFFVTPNKVAGWNRNVAQQSPHVGFQDVNSVGSSAAFTGRGAGVRQQVTFVDGYQTPKPTQPALEVFQPLLFWFNEDPRLSIPSVCIPYGQRYINVDLCSANELLQHLGAYPELDNPAANPVTAPDVEICELYINNIFVNPEIHDIYIKRIGFNLIRTHIVQTQIASKSEDNFIMNSLKWPIETLYVGMRPRDNVEISSTKMLDSWNIYAQTTTRNVNTCALRNGFYNSAVPAGLTAAAFNTVFVSFTGAAGPFTVDPTSWASVNSQLVAAGYAPLPVTSSTPTFSAAAYNTLVQAQSSQCRSTYDTCTPTIRSIRIVAQGIDLYREFPAQFYNSYLPYTYSGVMVNTPEDCGVLMITFNLYVRSYQPSGYLNASRSREFYIYYTSDLVGSTVSQADMVIVACAINFLLISDGSAVLRYAT